MKVVLKFWAVLEKSNTRSRNSLNNFPEHIIQDRPLHFAPKHVMANVMFFHFSI